MKSRMEFVMKLMMKIILLGLVTVALSACGLIDEEEAQSVVKLRSQILEIQTNEVDPLVDQIEALNKLIDPLEEEITSNNLLKFKPKDFPS